MKQRQKSLISKGAIGFFTLLVLAIRIASPFFHTHQFPADNQIVASQHCDACEYEATQAIEPDASVIVPVIFSSREEKVYELSSPVLSEIHSPSESRGPPQHS